MQERARLKGASVEVLDTAETGQHIRPRGEDVRRGEPLLRSGAVLRPYEIGLLAAQGIRSIRVVRLPKVAVAATGDELAAAGASLRPGQIRNSNGPALAAALVRWGLPVHDGGIAADGEDSVRKALGPLLAAADVLLVSGGVSVGDFDRTREALLGLGFEQAFWKVAIKPGKPLFFATAGRKLAFGLPGNPVAALVCLEEFVRPALERLQGLSLGHPSYHLRGRALNGYPVPKDRRQYLFCVARDAGEGFELDVIRPQGSAMLGMACRANALALADTGAVRRGDTLAFRWLK
jgi:molybdopterin molybdotransferase